MAGLNDTDIKLDTNWQLTQAANGDAPITSNNHCLFQDIQLEALTHEGELFYDESWGWSLFDFIQSQDDELTRTEIEQRIKSKLSNRVEVNSESIKSELKFTNDTVEIYVKFKFLNDDEIYKLNIELDRVNVEVVVV